jgi:hypothetical protein
MEYEMTGSSDEADQRLAERARTQASADQQGLGKPVFIGELVTHFREHELIDLGDEGKAYSTRSRCNSVLNKWVVVRQNVPCTIERLKSHLRWDVGINFPTFRRAF